MSHIAGMNNEVRRRGQRVDLGNCLLERDERFLIRVLLEPHVGVADLDEREISGGRLRIPGGQSKGGSVTNRPYHPCSSQTYALQKRSSVHTFIAIIISGHNYLLFFIGQLLALSFADGACSSKGKSRGL